MYLELELGFLGCRQILWNLESSETLRSVRYLLLFGKQEMKETKGLGLD